jgi:hypothetical protein
MGEIRQRVKRILEESEPMDPERWKGEGEGEGDGNESR